MKYLLLVLLLACSAPTSGSPEGESPSGCPGDNRGTITVANESSDPLYLIVDGQESGILESQTERTLLLLSGDHTVRFDRLNGAVACSTRWWTVTVCADKILTCSH